MKKFFFFAIAFLLLFSLPANIVSAESGNNSVTLLRISSGQVNSFVYLFPINTAEFENVQLSSTEIEGFKYFLKSRVGLIRDNYFEQAEEIDGMTVSEVCYYSSYDAIGFEVTFGNLTAYHEFFGSSSDDGDNQQTGFFVTKTFYEVNFPFQENVVETLSLMYSTTITVWSTVFSIDVQKTDYLSQIFENCTFTYQILSTQKKIYSENMSKVGSFYANTFTLSKTEIAESPQIVFWTVRVNYGWWYLFALVSTVSVVAVLLILEHKKRKKLQNFA